MVGRVRLAKRLAQATGRSIAESERLITNVGPRKAREAVKAAESGVTWKLPALTATGAGGALYWREQDVRTAEAIAEQAGEDADKQADAADMLELLLSPEGQDLPADLQEKLLEGLTDPEDKDDDDNARRPLESLFGDGGALDGFGGSMQQTVILLVVVLVVLNWALSQTSAVNVPSAGGVR